MKQLSRRSALGLITLLGGLSPGAWAQSDRVVTVADVEFKGAVSLGGQGLVLNGAGTSNILSSRATAVGLYLPKQTQDVAQALTMPGAKRVQVVALRQLSARDLASALLDRLRRNAEEGEIESNVLAIASLGGVFGSRTRLAKGDVVTLDYLPSSKSTEARVNGEQVSQPIVGEKFYPLLMKVWIGPKIRPATRDALMGVASS